MSSGSLLDSLSQFLTPDTIRRAAEHFGESEASIGRGLSSGSAAILAGLAGKAASRDGLGSLFDLLTNKAADPSLLDDVGGLLTGRATTGGLVDLSGTFLTSLFGHQRDKVGDAIGQSAGLSRQTVARMLPALAPMVMAFLNKRVRERNLGSAGLADLLLSQKDSLLRAAPAGIGNLIGLASLPDMPRIGGTREPAKARPSWLLPAAAVAVVLLGLAWFLGRPDSRAAIADAEREVTGAMAEAGAAAENAMRDAGDFLRRTLPGGVEISIPAGGLEARLIDFIESPAVVDETTWFEFDRLTFETNSARITPESATQVATLSEVLKAYPNVRVKIGGYTDNTGDEDFNMRLSQERADAVRMALVNSGVEAGRIESEGYGSQHPVASNDTEAGREQNRRIALRVTAK